MPENKLENYIVFVGGTTIPIVGMVFPPLLHIMVYFQTSNNEEAGKFNVFILLDIALMVTGFYISLSTIIYFLLKWKEIDNSFLDMHVKYSS